MKLPWSDDELETLRAYYPTEGASVIERLPGRTANAIMMRASLLGIQCHARRFNRKPREAAQPIVAAPEPQAERLRDQAEKLVGLPWMQWPTTEQSALSIAVTCEQRLQVGKDPDEQRFWSSLKAYMLALAERLRSKAA